MTPRDFAYWLQGFFEINEVDGGIKALTEKQTEMIRKHLDLVFMLDESIKPLRSPSPMGPTDPKQPVIMPSPMSYPQTSKVSPFGHTTVIC